MQQSCRAGFLGNTFQAQTRYLKVGIFILTRWGVVSILQTLVSLISQKAAEKPDSNVSYKIKIRSILAVSSPPCQLLRLTEKLSSSLADILHIPIIKIAGSFPVNLFTVKTYSILSFKVLAVHYQSVTRCLMKDVLSVLV